MNLVIDMRVKHINDSSYVFMYVLNEFYIGSIVDIKTLCDKFEYDKSSFYKMFDKINSYLVQINPDYEVIRISIGKYKMVKIE